MSNSTPESTRSLGVVPRCMGYLGLIPFVVLAFCLVTGFDLQFGGNLDPIAGLLNYAAIIISFIGAIHWGVALAGTEPGVGPGAAKKTAFAYSVLPALAAWGLLFLSDRTAMFGMALLVTVLYFVDLLLLSEHSFGGYLRMRLHLTIVVTLSLVASALVL